MVITYNRNYTNRSLGIVGKEKRLYAKSWFGRIKNKLRKMGYNITIFTFKLGIIISILIVILLLGSSLVNSFQNRESLGGFILNFSNIAVFVLAVLFGMFFWQYAKGIDKYILNEENKVKSEAEKLYWESRLAEVRYLKELGLDVSKDEALRKKHVDLVFKRERKNR